MLSINRIVRILKRNTWFFIRVIFLVVSVISVIRAFGYVGVYFGEVYIRNVPFSAVLNSLAYGGLFALFERSIKMFQEFRELDFS